MRQRLFLAVFAFSLFLSAGLMFNVQPMIGKMLLPRVGGAPAVWNVAMAFFQASLLTGYLGAYLLGKLRPFTHGLVYIAILGLALFNLPLALPEGWRPDFTQNTSLSIISVLLASVAAPFVALSLSAPTLQRLFANLQHERAKDPYFLYVASNAGSFVGLLIYPLWLETHFDVLTQTRSWYYAYILLLIIASVAVFLQMRHPLSQEIVTDTKVVPAKLTVAQQGRWVLLAFIPSSLTLGVTTYITTDVSATPLLWVITLGLYLLTFIIAFAQKGEIIRRFADNFSVWFGTFALAVFVFPVIFPWPIVALHLTAFVLISLCCHTQLSQTRPAAQHLTLFYFWLALGGALGGAFNAFAAPLLFNSLIEYPLVLLMGMCLVMANPIGFKETKMRIIVMVMLTLFLIGILLARGLNIPVAEMTPLDSVCLFGILMLCLYHYRWVFMVVGLIMLFAIPLTPSTESSNKTLYTYRNFFGVLHVTEDFDHEKNIGYRSFKHGNTLHGVQITSPRISTTPTVYYSSESPIFSAISAFDPKNMLVIGLGTGALACYNNHGKRNIDFIDIDADVVSIAQTYFTFLSACPPRRIIVGDGRLEMEKMTERYDLIVVDAFSSDSIPVHIATKEAVALYKRHLTQNGVIAFHISNRFFNLEPMVAAIAADEHLTALFGGVDKIDIDESSLYTPSRWVILAPNEQVVKPLLSSPEMWRMAKTNPQVKAWRDDYSNLLSVMGVVEPVAAPLPKTPEMR